MTSVFPIVSDPKPGVRGGGGPDWLVIAMTVITACALLATNC